MLWVSDIPDVLQTHDIGLVKNSREAAKDCRMHSWGMASCDEPQRSQERLLAPFHLPLLYILVPAGQRSFQQVC